MARIELAPEVIDDFDRFFEHLTEHEIADVRQRIADILGGLEILQHSPLIGRKVRAGMRELVIGQGSRGYVALYRFVPEVDTVFVLAFRSQREVRFKRKG